MFPQSIYHRQLAHACKNHLGEKLWSRWLGFVATSQAPRKNQEHNAEGVNLPKFLTVHLLIRKGKERKVAQSCPTLCDQVLEWVAISFSRGSSQPRDQTQVSRIAGRHLTHWATREAHNTAMLSCILSTRSSSPSLNNNSSGTCANSHSHASHYWQC